MLSMLLAASSSRADDKEVCNQAYEQGQLEEQKGLLRKARESYLTCAREVCPTKLRDDCLPWLERAFSASAPTLGGSA